MFVLGHIGVGRQLVARWRDTVPVLPLVLGTLLPDIIDKPLYYARIWPFISCTRTIGHTGLLMLVLAGSAYALRSRVLAAVSLGVATHLVLDCVTDWLDTWELVGSAWVAVTWPLTSRQFANYYNEVAAHFAGLLNPRMLAGEALGLALIIRELRRRKTAAVPVGERR